MTLTLWPLALLLITLLQASAFQKPLPQRRLTTAIFRTSDNKWDNLVDEDDETQLVPARPDMKYIPRNMLRQNANFDALRVASAGGPELVHDLYVPEPTTDEFWFIGKVAAISDVAPEAAVARQWALIEEHASNLRPVELFPHRGKLEIWMAPGDSELEVAYNRPDIVFTKMTRDVEGAEAIKSSMVGFQGEVYDRGGGMGFHTWRNRETGKAAKPEIETPETPAAMEEAAANSADAGAGAGLSADGGVDLEEVLYSDPKYRAPTEEELEKLQAALKDNNMDVSQLYDEQKKKEKEESDQ